MHDVLAHPPIPSSRLSYSAYICYFRLQVRDELNCPVAMGLGYGYMFNMDAMNCFGDEVNMAFKVILEFANYSSRRNGREKGEGET